MIDDLMMRVWPPVRRTRTPGHDPGVVGDQVEDAGLLQRHEVLRRNSWRGSARADASRRPTRRVHEVARAAESAARPRRPRRAR